MLLSEKPKAYDELFVRYGDMAVLNYNLAILASTTAAVATHYVYMKHL